MELARRVARNTFYNFTSLVLGSVSGLFLSIILARVLKPENFGVYSLAIVVANLCIALSTLGIDNAVVRYVSFYHGKGDLAKVRAHFRYFAKVKAVVTFSVSVILTLSAGYLAEIFHNESLTMPFIMASLVVAAASLRNFLASFMRGLQRFEYVLLKQVVYETSRWLFIIPLAFVFFAAGAVLGTAIAYLVSGVVLMIIILKKYDILIFGETSSVSEKVFSYMGFATVANIAGIVYAYVDSMMIGYLIDTTNVGFYRAAYTLVFAVVGFSSSLAGVLLPTFTQLSRKEIESSLERINRYISLVVFPMAILLSFFSHQIVYVLYGEDYYVAGDVMMVLALVIIPGGFEHLGSILYAREKTKMGALINFSGMLSNVFLNYLLILYFEVVGAAIATVISRFLVLFLIVIVLNKFLKTSSKICLLGKPILASGVFIMVLILLSSIGDVFITVLKVVLGLLIYYVVLIILKFIGIGDFRYLVKTVFRR